MVAPLGIRPAGNAALDAARQRIEKAFSELGDVQKQTLLRKVAHHPADARSILAETLGFAVPDDLALPWSSGNVVAIANDVLRIKAAPGGANGCHQALLRNVGPAFAKVADTISSMLDGAKGTPPQQQVQVELRQQFTRLTALADVMSGGEAKDANGQIRTTFDALSARGVQGFAPATRTLHRQMFGEPLEANVHMTPTARTLAMYLDAIPLGDGDARMVDPVRNKPISPTGHDDTQHLGSMDQPFGCLHPPASPRYVVVPTESMIDTKDGDQATGFTSNIDGIRAAFPISFDVGDGDAKLVDGRYHVDLGDGHKVELDVRDLTLTHHTPEGSQRGSIKEQFERSGGFSLTTPAGRQLVLQKTGDSHVLAVQRPGGDFAAVDFASGVVFTQTGDQRTVIDKP